MSVEHDGGHRRIANGDDQRLKASRYRWSTSPENMNDDERWEQFAELS